MTDTWATDDFEPKPDPRAFIQWKGTDICVDLHCACGYHGHFDGYFAYGLRCGGCGLEWTMPHTVGLIPGPPDGGIVQDAIDSFEPEAK